MTVGDHLLIRRATHEDLETLTEFSAAMARETEQRTLDRARLRMGTQAVIDQPERGQYFVAVLQQAPPADTVTIGQLLITYEWSDWRNALFWWIQSVYVHPAWRRKGVYRHMHRTILDLATSRTEVCGVRLYVEGNNRVAKQVYEQVGLAPSSYQVYETDFVLPHIESSQSESY